MMIIKKPFLFSLFCLCSASLTGCMSKNIDASEQQERMLRCDKYIGDTRERCLNGELVTIADYEEELAVLEQDTEEQLEAERELERDEKLLKEAKFEEAMSEAQKKAEQAKKQAIEAKIKEQKDQQ